MNEVVSWDMRRADMAMSHEDEEEDIMVEGYASLLYTAVRSSEIPVTTARLLPFINENT